MDEKTFNVHVKTPNHQFVFRDRRIRTPALFKGVNQRELELLKSQIYKESVNAVIEEVKPETETFEIQCEEDLDREVEVEELYSSEDEPKSTLEKLLKGAE